MIESTIHPFYRHEAIDFMFRKMFRSIERDDMLPRDSWATAPLNDGALTLAMLFDEDREVHRYLVEVQRPELEILMLDHAAMKERLWSDPIPEGPVDVEPLPVKHYHLRTGQAQAAVSMMTLFEVGALPYLPAHAHVVTEFDHVVLRAVRYWLREPDGDCGCQG